MKLIDHRKKDNQPQLLVEAILARSCDDHQFELFYIMEKQLFHHLYRLEKEQTKQMMEKIVKNFFLTDDPRAAKYFFITLSSLVARQLERNEMSPQKAFTFNIACFTLIDLKLTTDNTIEFSRELIEFYMYMLLDKAKPSLNHPTVNHAIVYIDERIAFPLTVEEIAKQFGLSTSHLSRIFREQAGVTLVEYMNMKKIEESQYFLRFSALKIAEISDRFNFCNQSYYTRIFKKYTGLTPRQFRDSDKVVYLNFTFDKEKSQLVNGHSLS